MGCGVGVAARANGEKREGEGRVAKQAELASWAGAGAVLEEKKRRGEEGSWAGLEAREKRERERLLGRARREMMAHDWLLCSMLGAFWLSWSDAEQDAASILHFCMRRLAVLRAAANTRS
jgi:hypothetical protein